MTVQVLLHTRPRGGRWSVEAQKKIFLPSSRQQAVEIITSGWVWETDVGLEMCWRHLWKRHRARLLKSMTQEIPSHNLCRWLIILGTLIMLWACSDLLRPSAGCWQSTQRGGCPGWVRVMLDVFLGKRHRGLEAAARLGWALLLSLNHSRGSWSGEKEAAQKADLGWILDSCFYWLFGSFCRMPRSSCPSFSASKYWFSLSSSPNLFLNYCFVLYCWKQGDLSHNDAFSQILSFLPTPSNDGWMPFCSLISFLHWSELWKKPCKIQVFNWGRCREKWEPSWKKHPLLFCCSGLCGNVVHLAVGSIKMQILYLHLLLTSKKDAAL